MKKPLLIGVSVLTLLTLGATLFAQTTTGTSLITEMKAAVRTFTLAGELNPGTTGLQSAPVSGKVTGDILTAGEWNRVLELVGQGGGSAGGFTTTVFRDITTGYTGASSIKTYTCPEGQYVLSVSSIMIPSGQYSCANAANVDKKSVSYNSCQPLTGQTWQTDIICGGGTGAGGGASWVDVPLTGTDSFDDACQYRVRSAGETSWNYVWQVGTGSLVFKVSTANDTYIAVIPKDEKGFWDYHVNGNSAVKFQEDVIAVAQIQKLCGGASGGGGGVTLSEQVYTNPSLQIDGVTGGPYNISCTRTDAAYYCGMHGSILVSMTCKNVGVNMVAGINYNTGQWSADDHYVVGGNNRAIDILKCANGIGAITDAWE